MKCSGGENEKTERQKGRKKDRQQRKKEINQRKKRGKERRKDLSLKVKKRRKEKKERKKERKGEGLVEGAGGEEREVWEQTGLLVNPSCLPRGRRVCPASSFSSGRRWRDESGCFGAEASTASRRAELQALQGRASPGPPRTVIGRRRPQLSPFTGQSRSACLDWRSFVPPPQPPPTPPPPPKPSPHPPRGLPVGHLLRLTMDGGADEIFMSQQISAWGGSGEWDWVNSTAPRFYIIIFLSAKQEKTKKNLEPPLLLCTQLHGY